MKQLTAGADAYVKAAVFGLGIFVAAVLIILVAILILSPSDIIFPIILLIPVTVAFLALRFLKRWGLIIAGLLSLFGLFALTADAGLTLTTPESFFDFVLTLFAIIGLGICLVACVVGTIQYFRKRVPSDPSPNITMALRGLAGLVAVLAVISVVLTVLSATDTVSANEKEGTVELVAEDTKWSTNEIEGRAGQPVRIFLKNDDPILHTLTIKDKDRGVDFEAKMGGWSEQVVEIDALEAGTYGFICRVEGHEEDMTGVLTIR
jgi:uncharacterized cupredoxin-like copper-binding protein